MLIFFKNYGAQKDKTYQKEASTVPGFEIFDSVDFEDFFVVNNGANLTLKI